MVSLARAPRRLGWIPLDSEEAIESLDDYAPEPEVHRFLHSRCSGLKRGSFFEWRVCLESPFNPSPFFLILRLVGFDVETLYELHYQMITLVKGQS